MENERQRLIAIVAAIAAAGLVLSCICGALAGSLAGLLAGSHQAEIAAERALAERRWEEARPWVEEIPVPLPELEEEMPFDLPGVEGALIVEVLAASPAEDAGLQPGDVIVAVDDVPIDRNHGLPDILAQYRPGDQVMIESWRAGQQQAVRVLLGESPDNPALPYLGVRYRMNLEPDYNLPGG